MMRKLFYKGKLITSDEAHDLPAEEKKLLTGRKGKLDEKEKIKKKKGVKK